MEGKIHPRLAWNIEVGMAALPAFVGILFPHEVESWYWLKLLGSPEAFVFCVILGLTTLLSLSESNKGLRFSRESEGRDIIFLVLSLIASGALIIFTGYNRGTSIAILFGAISVLGMFVFCRQLRQTYIWR